MKKYIYPMLLTSALFTAACSNDDTISNDIPDSEKEMISLSVGLGENLTGTSTRAIADPTYTGFTSKTRILMRLQSDNNVNANDKHKYTKTLAHALAEESGKDYSKVNQTSVDGAYVRYWDDAFGRNAHLSVFAVAIPNKDNADLLPETALKGSNTDWITTANDNKITWTVNNSNTSNKIQNADIIINQDLVYSNNIQKGSTVGGRYQYDFTYKTYIPNIDENLTGTNIFGSDRMRFKLQVSDDATSPGKFDKGHLVFNHALSRLTVTIKAGTGFDAVNKFILATESNNGIQALNMNVSGDLDVQAGTWEINATKGTITTQPTINRTAATETTPATASYSTSMQMLPDYEFVSSSNTNVLKFKIDDNEYYVTQDMIFNALKDNATNNGLDATATKYKMLQGKNYTLTITVNKTKIEALTATIAEWQNIAAADQTLYNSYVTLDLKSPTGTSQCENFDIYRMSVVADKIYTDQTADKADDYVNKNWMGNYSEHVTPTKNTTTNKWETTWYFEDNKTFYHFRTVNKGTDVKETSTANDDYFEITAGAVASVDPHWGAPMENSTATDYSYSPQSVTSATGYGANISKAIGSTKSDIKIQEFHMLSEINVIVKTVEGEAGVKLYDDKGTTENTDDVPSTVTLYQFKENGQVKMGNGLVTAVGDATKSQELTVPNTFFKTGSTIESNAYTWRVVPQVLSRGNNTTDKIALKIQTPDNNLYYCIEDLSKICPQGSTTPIQEWLPNHRYVYTFVISKKGIELITCTVADWIPVNAKDQHITLEN